MASTNHLKSCSIIGQRVDCVDYDSAAKNVIARAENKLGGYVCCSTVNMIMEGHDDSKFRNIVNSASLITPDGMPLAWGMKLQGLKDAVRVTGPLLMLQICQIASSRNIPIGLYGATEEVLILLQMNLLREYPDLEIAYKYSPPFRPLTEEEDKYITKEILISGVKILFIGLGTPKQVRWAAEHKQKLYKTVLICVGAAFDFHAGVKAEAPDWMQRFALAWLYRLFQEPKRLWRRYLYHNPRFIFSFVLQLFGLKKYRLKGR